MDSKDGTLKGREYSSDKDENRRFDAEGARTVYHHSAVHCLAVYVSRSYYTCKAQAYDSEGCKVFCWYLPYVLSSTEVDHDQCYDRVSHRE